ncbi:WG repeat-containing protein [Prevotella sp. HUN102]|uniref:WG repeat-containing protein n=1 Tax=Prevotella sp. HUN102 TaxID=1392486 RepID=UPI00048F9B9D|nr:WG repeat-containing protein [Prevotella sp. HUN102]
MEEVKIINEYHDPIEERQIRHFACMEMSRQIHRYIKGMRGSKEHMLRVEETLKDLPLEQKEKAIALYFDLNRKALKGLDMKVVLARAMANYSDTFEYLMTLVNDRRKMVRYLNLLREIYIQYHEVIERNGKFGILDHQGNTILSPKYEFVRTCYVYVDDLRTMPIICQLDGKMGLVLPDGKETVVAPFKYDSISLREEPPYFEVRYDGKEMLMTTDGVEKEKPEQVE